MANLISGSYNQRSRFLKRLKNEYKDITSSKDNAEKAQNLLKQIEKLNKELKAY